MAANLDIILRAQNQASGALRAVKSDLAALERTSGAAGRGFGGLKSIMGVGLLGAATTAGAGIAALGAGLGAATVDGFRINTSLENVRAQLVAFTKDGAKADQMLADIRTEAAKTPFAFEELASATASLLPASIQSGVALEDLIKQAEILAASNPAQGLEGAAFSLREALSGDFVSIIDRFNLPRARLNELKAEGVPAMEAITIAMREMGLDASLVSGMALTMTGRWSTFKDTMDTVKASLAQPLFDKVKEGLSTLQPILDANMPMLQRFATLIGEKIAGVADRVFRAFGKGVAVMDEFFYQIGEGQTPLRALVNALSDAFDSPAWLAGITGAVAGLSAFASKVRAMIAPILSAVGSFVSWKDALIAVGLVAASVVIPALAGIVTAALPVIAVGAALVAGVALVRNAWERDWGGIQRITRAAGESLVSWFGTIRAWLGDRLPGAIFAATHALQTFWGWIDRARGGDFGPLMDGLRAVFDNVIEWGRASVSKLWGVISDAIAGVKIRVAEWFASIDWGGVLNTVGGLALAFAEWVRGWLGSIKWPTIPEILSFGQWVLSWLGSVAWPALRQRLASFGEWVWTWLGSIKWPTIADFMSFANWVKSWLGDVAWPTIQNGFKTFTEWIGGVIGSIEWPTIADFVSFADWVWTWIGSVAWPNFKGKLIGFAEWVRTWMPIPQWPEIKFPDTPMPAIAIPMPEFDLSGWTWGGVANSLRDGILTAATMGVNAVDWSEFSDRLSELIGNAAADLDEADFTGVGVSLRQQLLEIDWRAQLIGSVGVAIAPGFAAAVAAWNWVLQSDAIAPLAQAVTDAFTNFQWSNVFGSLRNVWRALANSIAEAVTGFIFNGTGGDSFKMGLSHLLAWEWPTIPEWISILFGFKWPSVPEWITNLFSFDWPGVPEWVVSLLSFAWPEIVKPEWFGGEAGYITKPGWWGGIAGWIGSLFGGGGNGQEQGNQSGGGGNGPLFQNATGTEFFRGGLTVVGERGPELVALPRGSRIHNSEDTARMTGQTISVTVNATVASDIDAESLAYRIASIIQRRQRAGAYA